MLFEYFYGSQAEQFSFYRIPKILFTDETLSGISVEAKVLYSFMLDRMSLSVKNCWFDEENRVYIIYTIDGRSINLNHIHAGSCCNRLTNPAFSAGAVLRGVFTVYHLCKYLCDSSLSGPSGACKQICMADTIRPKLILQGGHNMILPLYISKPCRAKLSVKCRV